MFKFDTCRSGYIWQYEHNLKDFVDNNSEMILTKQNDNRCFSDPSPGFGSNLQHLVVNDT